jgi:hypothetical protein
LTRDRLRHAFVVPGVAQEKPVLTCRHVGCPVVWRPDRAKPAGGCRGRRPLQWVDAGPYLLPDCYDCHQFLSQPGMAEAVASVGIERGSVNVRDMVDRYHANRHDEEPR